MRNCPRGAPASLDRIRAWARSKAYGPPPCAPDSASRSVLPLSVASPPPPPAQVQLDNGLPGSRQKSDEPASVSAAHARRLSSPSIPINLADDIPRDSPPPAPPPQDARQGSVIEPPLAAKKGVVRRFCVAVRTILCASWVNLLLLFVPVGIGTSVAALNPTVVFVMNSLAIIPLAGLLAQATESVAKRMGDTVGALMNVTFGNAVEMIIFMYVNLNGHRDKKEREALFEALSHQSRPTSSCIALAHNEIRVVQAALLGSILANLLLILGMCFLIGGLRFREQIYNSTVTQMSACLLSLSVMSLLLPTAFHASFSNSVKADIAVMQVSRGTSVILLLVYGGYLLFQLKSHAYMYESTPQHIIDEESAPGPVAAWIDSSSSEGDSSSGSDSDGSRASNTTAGRIRRVMRGGRRRRKSSSSKDTDHAGSTRTPSYANIGSLPISTEVLTEIPPSSEAIGHRIGAIEFASDVDNDTLRSRKSRAQSFNERHDGKSKREHTRKKKSRRKKKDATTQTLQRENAEDTSADVSTGGFNEPRCVDFAIQRGTQEQTANPSQKKQFTLRGISIRQTIPKTLAQNIFTQPASTDPFEAELIPITGPIPRIRYGIRRTNSLPDRLNQAPGIQSGIRPVSNLPIANRPLPLGAKDAAEEKTSRTSAVLLLLFSTTLVAVCANFMVDSIDSVTKNTALGETFVGLILLPIIGNAAEHVTAVTVAAKNKMDLAIGVAVGSSIQIALFITPFVILLGWCMRKDMSLYFTLFETVSLFVSVFVVNFLVLDGRSNYLEGALLCAAYIIIAVAAFFYPALGDQNSLGGNPAAVKMARRLAF